MTAQTPPGNAGIAYAELATLRHLAVKAGADLTTTITCSALSDMLGVSTQTASRRLRQLDAEGLIERTIESHGQRVLINDHGLSALRHEYEQYRYLFDESNEVTLTGTVCTGMGEGQYFVSRPGYKEQFKQRLGYEPFEGTLNAELTPESARRRSAIKCLTPIEIDGWEDEERTYGPAVCYPASLRLTNGEQYEPAHVVAPKRTHHDSDQIEILAHDELREILSLDEGDQLTIHVKEQ